MNCQYVTAIINNACSGVPLIYKNETIMVNLKKKDYRVVTAYYKDLTNTEIFKLITSLTKSIQLYGDHGMHCLVATLDIRELDKLISQIEKVGELPKLEL